MGRGWSVLVATTWCLSACGAPQQTKAAAVTADVVLVNGMIFTGDPTRPRVQALAITGDRVSAIGTSVEIGRIEAPRRIDLGGRTVIPGINDAHVHEPTPELGVEIPGGFDTLTVRDMYAAIARATHEHPAGTWLHAELSRAAIDDPLLNRETLDRIAPAHPVWVDNFAGHAVVLNSAGMRAAGIDPKAPPPTGGFIGRDSRGGNDGWRYEYARFAAMRNLGSKLSDDDVVAAIRAFEAQAAELGITSVTTFPTQIEPARLVELLRASPRTLRWHVVRLPIGEVITPPYSLALVGQAGASGPEHEGMVTFYGTKYFLDGTPVERGAALRSPYSDQNTSGHIDWDVASVREMLSNAHATGDPLHLHIAGDLQIQRVLEQMEQLAGVVGGKVSATQSSQGDKSKVGDWPAHRVVIEHGDGIRETDMPRIRALGIVVVQNPSHTVKAELNRRRLGPRADTWMPLRSLLDAGIPLALGSDGALNPFLNIRFATEHLTNPGESLNVEEAVVAYTQGSAYGEHTENLKGKLVTGALADLAVLSQDVFTVPLDTLPRIRSLLTMVGGRVVYDKLSKPASPASGRSSARTE